MLRIVPTKVPHISDLLHESRQMFIVVTETWLNGNKDAEVYIDGYSIFRQDRNRKNPRRGRDSGGVALHIKDDDALDAECIHSFSNVVVESI